MFLGPNIYFAVYLLRCHGQLAANTVLYSFYKGEAGKFILSCLGFAAVFTLMRPIDAVALFATYALLALVQWLATVHLKF